MCFTALHAANLLSALAALTLVAGCGTPAATPVPTTAPAPATVQPAQPAATVFPVTVTDDRGKQVQIKAAPQRIVSTAPSNTEILFALGLDARIVGVTTNCNYPEAAKAKPKIGGFRPTLEPIVGQTPDLVVAIQGTPPDVVSGLEGLNVPVLVLNPPSFDGVLANIRLVGRATGTVNDAERLASQMQKSWNEIADRARTAQSKPRVFYEVDGTNPASVFSAGAGTFIDAMIATAGGVNVVAQLVPGQQYPQVSSEALIQANPQLIVLGDAPFGQSYETVAARPGWSAIEAVQKKAVVGLADPDVTSRAGPRLVQGLDLVAKAIHPEIFGAPPAVPTAAPRG
ncbi:MAG TPA: cobalamin-binding protein [Chloroflexota bacterium]|nr:cobalamin-binding protein [Chloroflexota bacterium]